MFCEHKKESNHLLYLNTHKNQNHVLILNENGNSIDTGFLISENTYAYKSCSTVLNGEAIIFRAGWSDRQVKYKIKIQKNKNI